MLKKCLLLLCLFQGLYSLAQLKGAERYKDGVTVVYQQEVCEYAFNLGDTEQHFYWGELDAASMPLNSVRFRIRNNTGQIVQIRRVGGGDGAVHYQTVQRVDYLLPDSSILVKPLFVRRVGPFSKHVYIEYLLRNETKRLVIPTWGTFPVIPPDATQPKDSTAAQASAPLYPQTPLATATRKADPVPTQTLQAGEQDFCLYIYHDNNLISDQCEVVLTRQKQQLTLHPATDVNGLPCFQFRALKAETIPVKIVSRDFGSMDTRLYCHKGAALVETFLKPGEAYYYAGTLKQRYLTTGHSYRVNWDLQPPYTYPMACDTVLSIIRRFRVKPLQNDCQSVTCSSTAQAIQLEKKLVRSEVHAHLEPIIQTAPFKEDETLSNSCTVLFRDSIPDAEIAVLLKQLGVVHYYKSTLTYFKRSKGFEIQFIHGADMGYLQILDRLWTMPEVLSIRQHVIKKERLD